MMASSKFLGMLNVVIVIFSLSSIFRLSKTFQTRAINLSRIIPYFLKRKNKLQQLFVESKKKRNLQINEKEKETLNCLTERYVKCAI